MSFFCCYHGRRRMTCREPHQDAIELPAQPPPVKLVKQPFHTFEPESSSPPILTTQAPSLLRSSIAEATVDPAILEVDDSDDDEPVRSARNSSTGTLGAIKTRLIRRLSQKSESKRHSQHSLGTSDEEIARRAELKRLMHKRIREELKSEEEQEEREESSNKIDGPSKAKPDNFTNVELLGSGPRDNIEFPASVVNEVGSRDLGSASPDPAPPALPISNSQPRNSLHRSSFPGPTHRSCENSTSDSHGALNERGSMPQFPPSPQLAPAHLSDLHGSESPCSWRLSYSAEQLANYLGVCDDLRFNKESDHSDTNDIPPDTESSQDSPLEMWLRSQELQSSPAVSSRKTSNMILEMVPESSNPERSSCQKGEASKHQSDPNPLPTSRNTPPGAWPSLPASPMGTDIDPIELPPGFDQLQHPMKGTDDLSGDVVQNTVDYVPKASSHYTSSRYTTRPNSCQAAEKEPRLSLAEFVGGQKAIPPIPGINRLRSPSHTTEAANSEASSYRTAPIESPTVAVAVGEVRHQQRPIVDVCSVIASDTASFKLREAELKSIAKRFGDARLRRDTTSPIVSKFREEFNEPRASIISKKTLFGKFHLPIVKRTKSSTKDIQSSNTLDGKQENKGNPEKDVVDGKLGVPPNLGWTSGDMQASEGSQKRRSRRKYFPDTQHRETQQEQECAETAQNGQVQSTSIGKSRSGPKLRIDHGPTLKPPGRLEDDGSQQSDISNSVLREWVNLMNGEESQSQVELKADTEIRGPRKLKTPPASWAKWPSHTRHERTGPAGKEDKVIPRDFAVRKESSGDETTWFTDKPSESAKKYITPSSRSLSAQFGKAMKGGLSKVVPVTLNRDAKPSADSERSRQRFDGHLEYPELEILPMQGGYKELQALEQQIGTMKRRSVPAESQISRTSPDQARTPLSLRLAEQVQKMQDALSGDDCQCSEGVDLTAPTGSPITPKKILLTPPGTSEATDYHEASESHIGYEDCVPKHMLEDEPPADNGIAAAKDRHTREA